MDDDLEYSDTTPLLGVRERTFKRGIWRPKIRVEPNRRCFLAMQLPSSSSTELYQNTIIQPPSRRFSAIELNAEELARRLLMIESPQGMPRGFFGDRIKKNSKRRSYECSVFEVVDLGPVSRDKGSTNSLGPAAVHRVSIRRRRPGSDKSEASKSQKSRSSVKSNKSTKPEELVKVPLPQKSRRKKLLCCCKSEDSDEELDTSMQTNANSTVPLRPEESPSVLLRAKRRISKLTVSEETFQKSLVA
ncbi:unnamed protein product, partial [Mesorhabditis belari]|uniref:Uncharacterized protein n=1 Tax=Mesorhabditis belari TaxID=2138241 RepID=A0AAF3FD18_9BILA